MKEVEENHLSHCDLPCRMALATQCHINPVEKKSKKSNRTAKLN